MIIAGFLPNSFVDYPQNIAAVVFLPGCNFNCWYCHNRDIIEGRFTPIDEEEVLSKIESRKTFLDGVVITGGEPLLTPISQLKGFIKKIKAMNLLVKLDTNGTNPEALKELMPLLDYVAMDIKAPLEKYSAITPISNRQKEKVLESINLLMSGDVDYEFRTTMDPSLTKEDIEMIAKLIKGAKRYGLQQIVVPKEFNVKTNSPQYIEECREIADKYVRTLGKNM